MTALLTVEARRAWSRRIWKGLVLFALGGIVLAGVLVFVNARPDPSRPDDSGFQTIDLVFAADGETGILAGVAIPFVLLAFMLGASLIGAEWRAGTMSVILAWESRRIRVMLIKAVVAAAAGALLALALHLALLTALLPSTARATDGLDAESWRGLAGILIRTSSAAALLALVGFAIASIGRNTTAGLAGGFLYLLVIENVLRGFAPDWNRWFASDNFVVLLTGNARDAGFDFDGSAARSAALLGVYVGALVAGATAWFRAHDVA